MNMCETQIRSCPWKASFNNTSNFPNVLAMAEIIAWHMHTQNHTLVLYTKGADCTDLEKIYIYSKPNMNLTWNYDKSKKGGKRGKQVQGEWNEILDSHSKIYQNIKADTWKSPWLADLIRTNFHQAWTIIKREYSK